MRGQGPGFWHFIALSGTLGVVAWAMLDWLRAPVGALSWESGHWRWNGLNPGTGQLRVCLDLQALLLLQWRADDASTAWVWLERSRSPERWSDLRRAVYSRANSDAPPGAEPPAATS
jgi:toxin CptA